MTMSKPCQESKETSLSLLRNKPVSKPEEKDNPRKCQFKILLLFMTLIFCFVLVMIFCFADYAKWLRCNASDGINLQLAECSLVHSLDSLSNSSMVRYIHDNTSRLIEQLLELTNGEPCPQLSGGGGGTTMPHDKCLDGYSMSQQELEYRILAEDAWSVSLEIFNDDSGWELKKGSSMRKGQVYSKTFDGIGRISKLKAYLKGTPEQIMQIFIEQLEEMSNWNPTALSVKRLQWLAGNVDIVYLVTKPQAGGFIASRDYVDLRIWKTVDNCTIIATTPTTHPDKPPSKHYVRAVQKPGGILFRPLKHRPGFLHFEWTFGTNLQGWIPQWAVDQGTSSALLDFLSVLRNKLDSMNKALDSI